MKTKNRSYGIRELIKIQVWKKYRISQIIRSGHGLVTSVISEKFLGFSRRTHLPEIFFPRGSIQEDLKDF